MRPTTLPDPTSDAPCGIFASFPQSGSGAARAAGAGEAHSAARGANGPHREGRRGKEGGAQTISTFENRIIALLVFPAPKPEAGRRAGRTSVRGVSLRTGVAVPCANIRAATAQELRVVDRDCIRASASRIFHAFPGGGKQARGTEKGGGKAPPAPKARRHGAPDGGGLHGPKGPQRREGEDVIVGHISISFPTETGCVSGAAERRAERDSKRAERKIALHRTGFCVPPQGAEAADRRRRRDRLESRAGALRRSGAPPNGRHRRRGDIELPGKRPDGEQRLRRNRMRSAFRTQIAEKRKHPKRDERFRRRRAHLRTSHAMRRDKKATEKRRTYPAKPDAIRASHANCREAETSETRRRLPEKAGASSDLARDVPGRKGYREAQNVSGDAGRDPRLARKSPRSGNIRDAPKASGEGGRIFGPRTRCAGTKRLPRSAERIRRCRTRSAPCTQIAEKRKHPRRAEGFRRRRAHLRTSHAMCRDEKATEKRRTYPAMPDAIRALHANRREAETSETRRRLPEKAGASSDLARDVPGRKGHREAQNVSGDTGRDPHFARKSPRSGNIRNAPNAYGEGGPRNGRSRGAAATGSRTFSALRKKAFRGGGICFFRGKSLYLYDI